MSEVVLSVAVLTVPSRAHYLADLQAQIGADWDRYGVDVYRDDQYRGVWWNAARAWASTPAAVTHRLILTEDIAVCRDFLPTVAQAVAARPDAFLSFYYHNTDMEPYRRKGRRWMPYTHPSGCAQLLPAAWAQEFVAWVAGEAERGLPETVWTPAVYGERRIADDALLFYWLRVVTGRAAWVAVPSLVAHRAWYASVLLDKPRAHNPLYDTDLCFIGAEQSGLELDWSWR